eukprot:GHRQ01025269.1.p1 GENE.GHRQ01025269.1~~GHRQ01025269.1.p1  ORF type:complete len:124 (+),score=19.21 GHRQ01025269.1:380-751(+)
MAEGQAAQGAKDSRYDWLQERVCSSLKIKEEQFQKLVQGEARAQFSDFLEEADTKRLLVYLDGKDLGVAIKPPAKFKRKTVYFVKTAPAKLDNDNIRKLVSCRQLVADPAGFSCHPTHPCAPA